ncbi:MAG: fumarate/nitrate reduction transcriptional regulator Fnr [Pseudomonadota bacterium]
MNETSFSLRNMQRACRTCSLHELCLPLGVSETDIELLEKIVHRSRPLPRGKYLFREGDPFTSIFVARSGAVKSFTVAPDGSEQIIGFHLPGELLGLDGLTEGVHAASARTLETVSVCEVPFERLEEAARHIPALQHQLLRLMSREITKREEQLLSLGKQSPERRLAVLLLSLSVRFQQRGYSATRFVLPMARIDIANFLGLAAETVSRLLRRLQDTSVLALDGRAVEILDLAELHNLAGAQFEPQARDGCA